MFGCLELVDGLEVQRWPLGMHSPSTPNFRDFRPQSRLGTFCIHLESEGSALAMGRGRRRPEFQNLSPKNATPSLNPRPSKVGGL